MKPLKVFQEAKLPVGPVIANFVIIFGYFLLPKVQKYCPDILKISGKWSLFTHSSSVKIIIIEQYLEIWYSSKEQCQFFHNFLALITP